MYKSGHYLPRRYLALAELNVIIIGFTQSSVYFPSVPGRPCYDLHRLRVPDDVPEEVRPQLCQPKLPAGRPGAAVGRPGQRLLPPPRRQDRHRRRKVSFPTSASNNVLLLSSWLVCWCCGLPKVQKVRLSHFYYFDYPTITIVNAMIEQRPVLQKNQRCKAVFRKISTTYQIFYDKIIQSMASSYKDTDRQLATHHVLIFGRCRNEARMNTGPESNHLVG